MDQSNAQAQLEQALVTTYLANLSFLNEYDNDLYQRIERLSYAIDANEYKERYHLEFLQESGEFDIYDAQDDKYLYNKDAKKFNNKLVDSVNLDKDGSFSTFEPVLFDGRKLSYEVDLESFQDADNSSVLLYQDVYKYHQILKEDTRDKKRKYKSIDKYVFIGTLLGRHIFKIANKIKAKNYMVIEPNLEIFRLSLFVIDYTVLARDCEVVFSIMDEPLLFQEKMTKYLMFNSFTNHTIKYITTDYNVKDDFDNIIDSILMYKPTTFSYFMVLDVIFRNIVNRVNKYPFLLMKKAKGNFSFFNGKPVLFVGAGPSLDDNMQWIKKNQNKFFIFSMGASYQRLLNNGIEPDVLATLDSSETILLEKQFQDEAVKKLKNTLIFASTNTSQKILNKLKKENTFLYEVMIPFKKEGQYYGGYSIGEVLFKLVLDLNVKELYLVGTDLALNQDTGFSHIKSDSSYTKNFDMENLDSYDAMETGKIDFSYNILKVKGNLDDEVITTRQFLASLYSYNAVLKNINNEEIEIYNLSTHGAYIDKTIPTKAEDIDTSFMKEYNKEKLITEELKPLLNHFSENSINEEEISLLKEELAFIEEQMKIFYELREKKFMDYEDFYVSTKDFINIISMNHRLCLGSVFRYFFDTINTYIDYCFKKSKLKKEKRLINDVSKVWFDNVEVLMNRYKKYINIALDKKNV